MTELVTPTVMAGRETRQCVCVGLRSHDTGGDELHVRVSLAQRGEEGNRAALAGETRRASEGVVEATSSASASQVARGGEYQPLPISQFFNVTRARTHVRRQDGMRPLYALGVNAGGRRKDSFAVVEGEGRCRRSRAPARTETDDRERGVPRAAKDPLFGTRTISSTPSSVGILVR